MTESNADKSTVAPDQKGKEMKFERIDEIMHYNGISGNSVSIEERIIDPPYTIFGNTSINPEFHLIMTYDGLAEIVANMKSGDSLRIKLFAGNKATEYSIVRKAVPRRNSPKPCPDCSGTGEIMQTPDDSTPCPSCMGSGESPAEEVDEGE